MEPRRRQRSRTDAARGRARPRRAEHDVPPVGDRAGDDDAAHPRGRRSPEAHAAWCSTRCPSCGCWRAAPSGTGARSSRSSSIFATRECTVVLLDDLTATEHDLQMQSIAHGVVLLEQLNPEYGSERRRLRVVKYRGVQFRGGYHDYVIRKGGIEVFPRLVAAEHRQSPSRAEDGQWSRRARRSAGRRHRRRHEHADGRCRGHRQVHARGPVRGGGGERGRARCACSSSTKARHAADAMRRVQACRSSRMSSRGCSSCSKWTPPS